MDRKRTFVLIADRNQPERINLALSLSEWLRYPEISMAGVSMTVLSQMAAQPWSLLIIDADLISVPELDLNVIEFAQRHAPDMRIIVAAEHSSNVLEWLKSGAHAGIQKPYDPCCVQQALKSVDLLCWG